MRRPPAQKEVISPTRFAVHTANLLLIAMGSLISCTSAQPVEGFPTKPLPTYPEGTPAPTPIETGQPTFPTIPFWTIAQEAPLGDHPTEPYYGVVTRPGEWSELHGQLPPAAIKAGRKAGPMQDHLIIAAYAGAKGSSGYSLSVDSLVVDGDRVIVTVSQQAPEPDAVREPAMTLPYHLVAVPTEALGPVRSLAFEFRDQAGLVLSRKEVVLP